MSDEKSTFRNEREFADFFGHAPLALHWASPDGITLRVNEAELRLLGYHRDDYLGRHMAEFHADPQVSTDILRRLHADEEGQDYEARLVCKDGTLKHVLIDANVLWEQGQFIHTRCYTRDITAQKQAEEALQQAHAPLEQRVQERTALVELMRDITRAANEASKSAEALQYAVDRICAYTGWPVGHVYLAVAAGAGRWAPTALWHLDAPERCAVFQQATQMAAFTAGEGLIGRVGARGQPEWSVDVTTDPAFHRQRPPERAAVALNTLVAETVETLTYAFQIDNIAVHLHLDDQVPPLWWAPHQLQQVLLNLLTNAQQALCAAPGAREITVTTHYDSAQQQITLAVADTGPGIPLALQGCIFEPFFTTKPPGMGTGLGLPLCRGIVEAHGGTLEARSAPSHGATFHITLPVVAVPALPPAPPSAAEVPVGRSSTILIIDDELSLATGLARLLQRDGHTADMVANGRLALAKLDECAYDLILCDVRMPGLDGPSFYRLLERQWPHLCQRFIFLTGDTLEPATQAFLEQSGAPCLTKPFSIADARRAIQRALHTSSPAAPAGAAQKPN
jgi:PAS domain S-box-containing protein